MTFLPPFFSLNAYSIRCTRCSVNHRYGSPASPSPSLLLALPWQRCRRLQRAQLRARQRGQISMHISQMLPLQAHHVSAICASPRPWGARPQACIRLLLGLGSSARKNFPTRSAHFAGSRLNRTCSLYTPKHALPAHPLAHPTWRRMGILFPIPCFIVAEGSGRRRTPRREASAASPRLCGLSSARAAACLARAEA